MSPARVLKSVQPAVNRRAARGALVLNAWLGERAAFGCEAARVTPGSRRGRSGTRAQLVVLARRCSMLQTPALRISREQGFRNPSAYIPVGARPWSFDYSSS